MLASKLSCKNMVFWERHQPDKMDARARIFVGLVSLCWRGAASQQQWAGTFQGEIPAFRRTRLLVAIRNSRT